MVLRRRIPSLALWSLLACCHPSLATQGIEQELIHNPFLRPAWLPLSHETNQQDANAVATGLMLRGTVTRATRPFALVNDELLEVGQSINGYQLLSIAEGQAVFIKNDKQLTLSVIGDKP